MRRWPVFVVSGLLIGITLVFVLVFITASSVAELSPAPDAGAYDDVVAALLTAADPARGEPLMVTFACNTCHVVAAEVHIAPPFAGIAVRAAERRPPLTAAEYIYESITNPSAYIVEGFAASMPQDYRQRLTDQQLGDIIAFLLTLEAEVD